MKALNIFNFTVIILLFLTFKLEATPTVQYSNNGNSGTLTLTSDDCSYEGWSHYITINIPANKLVKYTLTTNTYDYLEIWSSTFFNCIDFPESYSHTIISSEGKIYIYCQDNGYGLPNTAVFYFSFELDTPATLTPSNAYIPGYLGIGTSSPQESLHINGNVRGNSNGGALRVNTQSGYLDLGSMNGGFAHIYTDRPNLISNAPIWSIPGVFSAYQSSDLKLQTNGTTRMSISAANGNVGIGTTPSSTYTLDIEKDVDYQFRLGNGGGLGYNIGRSRSTGYLNFYGDQSGFNGYVFGGANGTFMTIKNNGRVGIGTNTPNADFQIGNSFSDIGIPKMRITAPGTGATGSVIDALHIDSHDGGNFDKGVAISLGLMNATYGEYTSRIVHFGNTGQTRASKLQLQTHSSTHGVWNTGVLIDHEGKVGIGTKAPDQMLTVKGKIHAEEVIIDLSVPAADYVFNSDYSLMPLHKVEAFVKTNKHLPEIPSAAEVKEKGLSMGEMQNKLLQKIEELTLYVIELQKTNEKQSAEIEALKSK